MHFWRKAGICSAKLVGALSACANDSVGGSAATILAELVANAAMKWSVRSGLETMQAWRHHPDVVLMDYQILETRMALLLVVRSWQRIHARIILVSGCTLPCEPKDVGAIAILIKPVQLHRLYEALPRQPTVMQIFQRIFKASPIATVAL